MEEFKLYIKNMVCRRCMMAVERLLHDQGIEPLSVGLGVISLPRPLTPQERTTLDRSLREVGFELIDGRRERLIEQVKSLIIELIHNENNDLKVNLSDYLSSHLHHDYNYISSLFSEVEGITIEKYFIHQKIERVKELLVYDELSLGEIAALLNYSSVAHLSAQFKKVTGLTPSHFRTIGAGRRRPLDEV